MLYVSHQSYLCTLYLCFSAILYLNDKTDFDGGEFFFAHSNKTEQVCPFDIFSFASVLQIRRLRLDLYDENNLQIYSR